MYCIIVKKSINATQFFNVAHRKTGVVSEHEIIMHWNVAYKMEFLYLQQLA